MVKNGHGIIIKKIPFNDYDSFIFILTKKNILKLKAIGINKAQSINRTNLFLLNEVYFSYFFTSDNVKFYKIKNSSTISFNTDILMISSKIINIVNSLINWIFNFYNHNKVYSHKKLFYIFKKFLIDIRSNTKNLISVFYYYMFKILNAWNYHFVLNECIFCKNKDIFFFNPNEGGTICKDCLIKNKFITINNEKNYLLILEHLVFSKSIDNVNLFLIEGKDFYNWLNHKISIFFSNSLGMNFKEPLKINNIFE